MRPVSLNAATATTNVVDLSFGYDNSLNILSITDNVGSIHDHALSYDGLDRLVSASGPWGSELIEYEPNGNIYARNRNGTVQDYYYNNMKLDIRAFPGYYMVVTHDSRGNLTSDGPNVYSYNADNKLISATTATETINYAYDGQGTRVSRTDSSGDLHYLYSANGLLMGEYNPAGGFDEYVYVNRNLAARIHDDTTIVGTP